MGLIKRVRDAAAERDVDDARAAWDAGSLAYVMRAQSVSGTDTGALTAVVSAVLEVGWRLASSAAVMNTVGVNREVVIFTFVRPATVAVA